MIGKLLQFERRGRAPESASQELGKGVWRPVQQSLFPLANVVVIVSLSEEVGRLLPNVMNQARPGYVFDFRAVPRFDFGTLNRYRAFEVFEKVHSKYFDIGNDSGEWRQQILNRFPMQADRPIMFLIDGLDDIENRLVSFISENRNWAIHKISNQPPAENTCKVL